MQVLYQVFNNAKNMPAQFLHVCIFMKYYKFHYYEDSDRRAYVYNTPNIKYIINIKANTFEVEVAYKLEEKYFNLSFTTLTEALAFCTSFSLNLELLNT
jgi:hypothetical protein